jgi:hypothetical protein
MLKLSEGQLIGVNFGTDDNPYVVVGQIQHSYNGITHYVDEDGIRLGVINRDDPRMLVLNPINESNPFSVPTKIENNHVVAWS